MSKSHGRDPDQINFPRMTKRSLYYPYKVLLSEEEKLSIRRENIKKAQESLPSNRKALPKTRRATMKRCKRCSDYKRFMKEQGKETPGYLGTCIQHRFGRRLTTLCNVTGLREFDKWLELQVRFADAEITPKGFSTIEELEVATEKFREDEEDG
jgi:hypothetical protein